MNEYINLTKENIEHQHICCAIGDKKHIDGVVNKKEWIKNRLPEGHIFRKLNAQGKIFIEYAPLESAWTPIIGENFLYIYCLWVAGSFKGKGYARELLEYAIQDAKNNNKNGLCVLSSKKKKPFLSEKSFFEKFGFEVVDIAGDYELLAYCFDKKSASPKFTESAKLFKLSNKNLTIFYSLQCPYTNNCIKELETYCKENKIEADFIKIDTLEKAKSVPCVFNNWATFINGKFISNTLLNKNSLEKLLKNL